MICFAPHPDDETIGAGGHLFCWPGVRVVHATDGAPRNMEDARRYGFATREDYAEARRREVIDALQVAGIGADRLTSLGVADQESCRNLVPMVYAIRKLLSSVKPETVLAPAYEGGHPDHDSLAFAVHCACAVNRCLRILEYPMYHAAGGEFKTGEFIPIPGARSIRVTLSRRASAIKLRMLECFVTQRETLSPFRSEVENFRIAPSYDFSLPPHEGKLFYENFPWGVTGSEWRKLATEAMKELGL